uniref:Uncharacterized protein n=1 Tax=Ditylum brightwellii TaxID=49249 RepID=A0A7S4RIU7_9STRA
MSEKEINVDSEAPIEDATEMIDTLNEGDDKESGTLGEIESDDEQTNTEDDSDKAPTSQTTEASADVTTQAQKIEGMEDSMDTVERGKTDESTSSNDKSDTIGDILARKKGMKNTQQGPGAYAVSDSATARKINAKVKQSNQDAKQRPGAQNVSASDALLQGRKMKAKMKQSMSGAKQRPGALIVSASDSSLVDRKIKDKVSQSNQGAKAGTWSTNSFCFRCSITSS